MKNSTLIVIAILAVAGYFLFKDKLFATVEQAPANANPTGGATTGTQQPDAFGQILGIVSDVFATVKSIAQTQPKTT